MATPTAAQVKAIVTTSLDDAVVDALIADAELMAGDCISGLDDDLQTSILKWLGAHFVKVVDDQGKGAVTSKKLGDAQTNYSNVGMGAGLESTTYGQQALRLDTTGCLANLGKGRAILRVV